MLVLATYWYPDLNPLGFPSIAAVAFLCVLILLSWRTSSSSRWRKILAAAPALMLTAWGLTSPLHMRRPDADDYAAEAVCLAGAFGFALASFRVPRRAYRIIGAAFTTVSGALIVHAALEPLCWYSSHWPESVIPWVFIGLWSPGLLYLWRRSVRREKREKGFCVVCGYDLRASYEFGRCPECGTQISRSP